MPQRGVYRGVFANLVDDPDFQALPSHARHVLLTIRLSQDIGPAGIFRFYVGPLVERTGYQEKKVEDALDELEKPKPGEPLGWIVRDASVLWVVNALRHDPTIKLADPKHRTCVLRAISGLPKSDIVLKFCDYYNLPRAFDGPSRTPNLKSDFGSPNPIPNPIPNPVPNPKEHTPPEPPSECSVLLNFWSDLYLDRNGQRPEVEGKRDMTCSKALLSGRTLDQAKAIITYHFDHAAPFYAERSLYGIHHIRKDCNQIIARMKNGRGIVSDLFTEKTRGNARVLQEWVHGRQRSSGVRGPNGEARRGLPAGPVKDGD